ncbi:O-antigen polymerase [Acinetobacter indicus]|uniref:O-antigen polymerase n=1 Tax=Acinetobacter indicus TaxID=756892 RepID=UPI000CEC2C3A|nr:O-antigen polymerase [Acinetobacter indicus]
MYLKLFYPYIFLSLCQVFGFYFYNGFSFYPKDDTKVVVSLFYFFSILAIVSFCLFNSNNIRKDTLVVSNKKIENLFLIITIFFILKPAFIMLSMGVEYGFDYVRQNFFTSDLIRSIAFGNMTIAVFTQSYIVPILWFYVIYLTDSKERYSKFTFYFILFSLVIFNLSYAGRFYIYFAIIVLYLKNVIERKSIMSFFKKNSYIIGFFFIISTFVVALRNNRDGLANESNDLLKLVEYHLLQPYFFAQKIDSNELIYDGYPFRVILEGFFSPILYFFGVTFKDLPQGKYSRIFDQPTLFSEYTNTYYNAFSTFFPYIYIDFGGFSVIYTFILIFIFLSLSRLISNLNLRFKYLAYISLILYFSLFQSTLFSYGTLIVIILFPITNFLYIKLKKD